MAGPGGRPPAAATLPLGPPDPGRAARAALEARWLALVREALPAAAAERARAGRPWPVRLDHCFARVLLDAACGAPWRTRARPPAYRHLPDAALSAALALGEAVLAGRADLRALNARSLALRARGTPRR